MGVPVFASPIFIIRFDSYNVFIHLMAISTHKIANISTRKLSKLKQNVDLVGLFF